MRSLRKPRQFGRTFGVTERTVRSWIAKRIVEVIKIGASVRIPASEEDRLIREGRRPADRRYRLGRRRSQPRTVAGLSDDSNGTDSAEQQDSGNEPPRRGEVNTDLGRARSSYSSPQQGLNRAC
jgi:hypothetical protein